MCLVNRIRRVKCDEEKPSCRRCTSTGRKCDGYAALQQNSLPEPRNLVVPVCATADGLSGNSSCSAHARVCFRIFRELCAMALTGYGTQGFWQTVVLQASDRSAVVKHLMIAASSLRVLTGESTEVVPAGQAGTSNVPFLAHYGRALRLLGTSPQSDVVVVLVSCVLLAVCEELQQNDLAAQWHIEAGKRILASQQRGTSLRRGNQTIEIDEITSTFSQLSFPRPTTASVYALCMTGD